MLDGFLQSIKDFFNGTVVTLLGKLKDLVVYLLESLIGYISDLFWDVWDLCVDWFCAAFEVIANYLIALAQSNGIDIDPTSLSDRLQSFVNLFDVVSYWLPLKACVIIFVGEWAIRLSMRAVRWIIGFIPTVEG